MLAPLLEIHGIDVYADQWHLLLLITASVLIAMGGYVQNDYFDVKIDSINRPEDVLIGKSISKQKATLIHLLCTSTGMLTGLGLSMMLKSPPLAFIFVATPGLLWFYSASYKRQLIIGNLVVAFISALSIITVALSEIALLKMYYNDLIQNSSIPATLYAWTCGFAFFSFLLTWILEIIKDMESEYGDKELECRTMPIVWGKKNTKIWLITLIILTAALLFIAYFQYIKFSGNLTLRYIIFGFVLPLGILTYLLVNAKVPSDYSRASALVKFILVTEIFYTVIFYSLLSKETGIKLFHFFIIE